MYTQFTFLIVDTIYCVMIGNISPLWSLGPTDKNKEVCVLSWAHELWVKLTIQTLMGDGGSSAA